MSFDTQRIPQTLNNMAKIEQDSRVAKLILYLFIFLNVVYIIFSRLIDSKFDWVWTSVILICWAVAIYLIHYTARHAPRIQVNIDRRGVEIDVDNNRKFYEWREISGARLVRINRGNRGPQIYGVQLIRKSVIVPDEKIDLVPNLGIDVNKVAALINEGARKWSHV